MRWTKGAPCRLTSVPKAAAEPSITGPKRASAASSFHSAWKVDCESPVGSKEPDQACTSSLYWPCGHGKH